MKHAQLAIFLIAIGLAGAVGAQAPAPALLAAPAALAASDAGATAPAPSVAPAAGGIQGQNIFDVRPDASEDPGYAKQTNG